MVRLNVSPAPIYRSRILHESLANMQMCVEFFTWCILGAFISSILSFSPQWQQPPLLRPDRVSVLLSSFSSSSLLLPKHFRFPPGAERSPLPHCPVSVPHTHTQICSHVSAGWLESCCAVTPDPLCICGTKLCSNRLSLCS